MELGTILRRYRVLKGYTQEWISDNIGLSSVAYQNYELNKSKLIHPNFFKLCQILDVDPCTLIREYLQSDDKENIVKEVEPSYLTDRISLLEKRQDELIAENAVLKYRLSKHESPEEFGNSKKVS